MKQRKYLYSVLILVFSFVLYGNTIGHGYVLDDTVVITGNPATKKGLEGMKDIFSTDVFKLYYGEGLELPGGRYRPLSVMTFALEYELLGGKFNPGVSHFINVLLYGITGIVIYLLCLQLFNGHSQWLGLAAALLFVAHPIHTEVVANIKSRDEIMAFLFCLLSLMAFLRKGIIPLLLGGILFFLALLGKENAITFLAVIPLFLILIQKNDRSTILMKTGIAGAVAVLYLILRFSLIGAGLEATTILDDPYLGASFIKKLPVLFLIAGKYLQLLVFPHPLLYDYSYNQVPLAGWASPGVIVSVLVITGLLFCAFRYYRQFPVLSFAIGFYFVTYSVASNVFVNIGTSMGERFIYFSSFGICLGIAWALGRVLKINFHEPLTFDYKFAGIMFVVLGLFSFKTVTRNKVWDTELHLYTTDMPRLQNNVKALLYYGIANLNKYQKNENKQEVRLNLAEAIKSLRRATIIYSRFIHANYELGRAYNFAAQPDSAIFVLSRNLEGPPSKYKTRSEIELANAWANGKRNPQKAVSILEESIKLPLLNNDVGLIIDIIEKTAICYGMMENYTRAAAILENAIRQYPEHIGFYQNLGITYNLMGDEKKGSLYFQKAQQLKDQSK